MKKLDSLVVLATLSLALFHPQTAAGENDRPKVLLVISNQDFYGAELSGLDAALKREKLGVVVAAATLDPAVPHGGSRRDLVNPDVALADVNAEDYSAIVFAGGWGASSYQYAFEGTYHNALYRPDPRVAEQVNFLIAQALQGDEVVAAIGYGVSVLAWARVEGESPLDGRMVVSTAGGGPGFRLDGQDYGDATVPVRWQMEVNRATMLLAESIGDPVVAEDDVYVDGTIITAQDYRAAAALARAIARSIRAAPGSGR